MPNARDAEIRQNFDYFQGVVKRLMPNHAGEYVLLHACAIVEIYQKPFDALSAGHEKFCDGLFSVQRVIDHPLDLGFMSYGSGKRPTD